MGDFSKSKVLFLTQDSGAVGLSGTNNHVNHLFNIIKKEISATLDVAEIDNAIPPCFVKFINSLADGEDFNKLKSNLTYDMKSIVNSIRKKVKDFDVIHVHHAGVYFDALIAKIFFDKQVVVTAHTLITKRISLIGIIGQDGYNQRLLLEELLFDRADAIIVTYKRRREEFLKYYPNVSSLKVHIVYNGISISEFYPASSSEILNAYDIDDALPYVMFVGNIMDIDDVNSVVDVVKKINKYSQSVLMLRFLCDDSIILEAKKRIGELNKSGNKAVFVDAALCLEDKRVLYSQACVVCYPLIHEPSGFVILEALSCGSPVVSTAIGCVKEIIKHGEGGFLIEPGLTPEPPIVFSDKSGFINRFSEASKRIVIDKFLNRRLSVRSREGIEESFSWETIATKTMNIYRKIFKA